MKMNQKQGLIVIAVVVVAIIAVGVVIALSGRTNVPEIDYASLPNSRSADGAFVLGDPNARVTIIEFADFACPHCQEYRPEIEQFIRDYVVTGRARFEFRIFATSGGEQTIFLGRLAECMDNSRPGAFWAAYPVLYELAASADYFRDDVGRLVAQRLNVSYSDVLTCTSNANQIVTDMTFGQNAGVSGTPAVMMRLDDGEAQWITYNGTTYDRGAVGFAVLAAVVDSYS
jgi:protein-disulfide isomerase